MRGFLQTLPTQYAELAVKKECTSLTRSRISSPGKCCNCARACFREKNFERQVFFVADPYKPQPGSGPRERASFYGCALCHDVQPVANAAPFIAKPVFVDRWMPQAKFNHARHTSVNCNDCHRASQSRLTSDVLMPGIANCVSCHSPKGKVVTESSICHSYHAPAIGQGGRDATGDGVGDSAGGRASGCNS